MRSFLIFNRALACRLPRVYSRMLAFATVLATLACLPESSAQNAGSSFQFATAEFTYHEGDTNATITVTRISDGPAFGKMEVDLIIQQGTATNNVHFKAPALTNVLTFSNFQHNVTFALPTIDNTTFSTNIASVQASLKLANPRSVSNDFQFPARLASSPLTNSIFKILENDKTNTFTFSKSRYVAAEGGQVTLEIVLANPVPDIATGVSVDYEVRSTPVTLPGSDRANVSATNETNQVEGDVAPITGTLTFGPGQTSTNITIAINTDTEVEFNEDFRVYLTNPQGEIPVEPPPATDGGTTAGSTGATDGGDDTGTTAGSTGTTGITTSGITGNTTAGTTSGTDGGTDGTETPPPIPYEVSSEAVLSSAFVTIQFNRAQQPAGSVDNAYNMDNSSSTMPPFNPAPGANRPVFAVAEGFDGTNYIAGEFTAYNGTPINRIARVQPDGMLDPSFNPPGGANEYISSIAVYRGGPNSGKILVAGGFTSINGARRNGIARMNIDGSVDETFNPGQGANGPVYAVALHGDGGAVLGGSFTTFDGIERNGIAKVNADGQLDLGFDSGFGVDGPVYTIFTESPPSVTTSSTGTGTNEFNQVFDMTSGSAELSLAYLINPGIPANLELIHDGVVVWESGLTNTQNVITNEDGSFTTNGVTITTNIYLGGNSRFVTFRVNDGNVDETNSWTYTAQFFPQAALGMVIGGDFRNVNGIPSSGVARLNARGIIDTDFASNLGLGTDGPVYSLDAFPDGSLVVGGEFTSVNSLPYRHLAKLKANGEVDIDFLRYTGPDNSVLAVHIDGPKIYIGGRFTTVHNTLRVGVARLYTDGTVDTTWMDSAYNQYAGLPDSQGVFPSSEVRALAVTAEGVLIGGVFNQVGGGGSDRDGVLPRRNFAQLVGDITPGPGNGAWTQASFGGDEGAGVLSAGARRINGRLGAGLLQVISTPGSATEGVDYEPVNSVLTWAIAGGSLTIGANNQIPRLIPLFDDQIIEGDETFGLQINGSTGGILLGGSFFYTGFALGSPVRARAQIVEDDTESAVLNFSAAEYDVNENDRTATITVVRTGGISAGVTVRYSAGAASTSSATPNVDFDAITSGTLSFASGQTSRSFTVSLRDDELVEEDEIIALQLVGPSRGAVLGITNRANINLIDNDLKAGRVSFSANNYLSVEGSNVVITVKRTGGNVGVLRVDYSTADLSATAPEDYTAAAGTLIWNDLESTPKNILIPLPSDGLVEVPEQFRIFLSNATPSTSLGTNRTDVTVTITDDDAYGQFSFQFSEYLADEIGTNVTVTVIRRNGSAQTASVDYATSAGTNAVAGLHYLDVSGTLVFGVGEVAKTFEVPILDDSITNGERRVNLTISNPQPSGLDNGPTLTEPRISRIGIIDNETFNIPAGSVDTDFAINGGANGPIHEILVQTHSASTNLQITVAGEFTAFNRDVKPHIARITGSGILDPVFNPQFVLKNGDEDVAIQEALLQSDGKILVAGEFSTVDGLIYNRIFRITPSGDRDSTFNPGSGADNPVLALAETTNSVTGGRRLLVGGSFSAFNGFSRRGIAQVYDDGRTDLTFEIGSGVNGTVYAIAVQRDGKIVIGGDFTGFNGVPRLNIARLNSNGSIDESFDTGPGVDGIVRAIAIGSDDQITIAGQFTSVSGVPRNRIARLTSNGNLDSEFDPGTGANGPIFALALQQDGRILAGGGFTEFNTVMRNRIVRLNHDGSIDTSINFGKGPDGPVNAIAIQPDRRILIGGQFTHVDDFPRNNIARLFGGQIAGPGEFAFDLADFVISENTTNGLVTVRRVGGLQGAVSVQYETLGVSAEPGVDYQDASGTLTFRSGENIKSFFVSILDDNLAEERETIDLILSNPTGGARLGRQQVATLSIRSDDAVIGFAQSAFSVSEAAVGGRASIAIRREGEISTSVTVSYSATSGTASGSDFDPINGQLTFGPGESIKFIIVNINDDNAVEANETVILTLSDPSRGGILGRAQANLTIIDNDFAPGVLSIEQVPDISESGGSVTLNVVRTSGRTGSIAVDFAVSPGTATAGVDYQPVSGRLNFEDNETLKTITIPIRPDDLVEGNEFFQVRIQSPTGGAILGNPSQVAVTILDDDFGPGSFDQEFAFAGVDGPVNDIVLNSDGTILIGGEFSILSSFFVGNVARVLPNGSRDISFSAGDGTDGAVNAIESGANGQISIGGAFSSFGGVSRRFVGRLQPNGFAVSTFSNSAGENDVVHAVLPAPDGDVLVGGSFTSPAGGLIRVNANGSLDPSFNTDGGFNGTVFDLEHDSSGRILVAGNFTRAGTTSIRGIARLRADGLLDTSFAIGGGVNGTVHDVDVLPDGQILLAGDFTSVNGTPRSRIVRLNPNGSIDLGFSPTAPNAAVYAADAHLGKIYIGGDFTSIGNTTRNRVARLNSDGSLDTAFDPGIGPDNRVLDIEVQSDGQVLIAGLFTTASGSFSPGLARLNGDKLSIPTDVLISNTRLVDGRISFTFTSDEGRNYVVESTINFQTWTPVQTVTASGSSSQFTAPSADGGAHRFYRVRIMQ